MRVILMGAKCIALCLVLAAPCSADLVAHYTFDDSFDLGTDSSGNGYHATNNGASFDVNGYSGGGALLFGTGFIRAPIDVDPAAMGNMTWGAWVRPISTNPIQTILSNDDAGFDRSIVIDARGGSQTSYGAFRGSGVLNSGIAPTSGEWTFLAVAYDNANSSMTFYVDDQSFTTSTSFGSTAHTYFDIGHNPSFNESFSGTIDEVFVFNETLSGNQIATIRTSGVTSVPEPNSLWLVTACLAVAFVRLLLRRALTIPP